MADWRRRRTDIAAIVRHFRRQAGVAGDPSAPPRPEAVEPAEVALILLSNAARLLDEAAVPDEVKFQLAAAIGELKAFLAEGPR